MASDTERKTFDISNSSTIGNKPRIVNSISKPFTIEDELYTPLTGDMHAYCQKCSAHLESEQDIDKYPHLPASNDMDSTKKKA